MVATCLAQDETNYKHLYNDWVISTSIVDETNLELRPYNIWSKKSKQDQIVSFQKAEQNILFKKTYRNSGPCVTFLGEVLGFEKWMFTLSSGRLQHLFLDENQELLYSSTYEIVELGQNILKLKRVSEHFNGN